MSGSGYSTDATALISSPQNFTGSWADLGGEIKMQGYGHAGLYLQLDVNDSLNMRVRLLAKTAAAGALEYTFPIYSAGTSDVKVEDHYFEFNVDADQNILVSWDLDKVVVWGQFQIQAGTAGASPGQVDAASYTLGA